MADLLSQLIGNFQEDLKTNSGQSNTIDRESKLAEIGLRQQQAQEARAKVEQARQKLELDRLDGYFSSIDTGFKLPDETRRSYFKNVLPQRAMAYGIDPSKLNPAVQTALVESPETLRAYANAMNAVRNGTMNPIDTEDFFKSLQDPDVFFNRLPDLLGAEKERIANAAKEKVAALGQGNKQQEDRDNLRKELTGHKITQESIIIDSSYRNLKRAFGDSPSAAGDLKGLYSFMKMLDPATGIKEAEFGLASSAGNIPDRIKGQWEQLINGQRLTDRQRKDFLTQAEEKKRDQQEAQDMINNQFAKIAETRGYDPKEVLAGAMVERIAPKKKMEKAVPGRQNIIKLGDRDVDVSVIKERLSKSQDPEKFLNDLAAAAKRPIDDIKKLLGVK